MSEACLVTRTQAVLDRFAEALNAAGVATYRWVRAFFAYGISRSIAHRSTLSAGHGL
jgi:hypothetical protein